MPIEIVLEMGDNRGQRNRDRPPQRTDGGHGERFKNLIHGGFDLRPMIRFNLIGAQMGSERRDFLGAEPAGHALAAGFVAKKFHGVDRLIEHVAALCINDEPRTQLGGNAQGSKKIEVEFHVEEVERLRGWIESVTGGQFLPGL